MLRFALRAVRRPLTLGALATIAMLGACADQTPVAPDRQPAGPPQLAARSDPESEAVATLRYATRRYRDLDAAVADGFVLRLRCEERSGGASGDVYINTERAYDGVLYPEVPDGLIYEPGTDGRAKLVGVVMAWGVRTGEDPPTKQFLGTALAQIYPGPTNLRIYAVNVWAWRDNPNGLTAVENPRVSCGGA